MQNAVTCLADGNKAICRVIGLASEEGVRTGQDVIVWPPISTDPRRKHVRMCDLLAVRWQTHLADGRFDMPAASSALMIAANSFFRPKPYP